jgi:uncharacterized protein YqjF (DUF2071 family)
MLIRSAQDTPFLTAEWRALVMLNYEIDPGYLLPLAPKGTELDSWSGKHFVSVVGFLFLNTRVLGLAMPFHRNFEEINLRFYVKREAEGGRRRGVAFIKEIVPRAAVALAARWLYNENYVALPTWHAIRREPNAAGKGESVAYGWTLGDRAQRVEISTLGEAQPLRQGSEEEFIAERYWGYSWQKDGGTVEYRVDHPPWLVRRAQSCRLQCDAERLYGRPFADALRGEPSFAFLAEGSEVAVFRRRRIA